MINLKQLENISCSRRYWLAYVILCTGLIGVALFFQYALDEPPCVVCIHVRLWVSLLLLVSLAGLMFHSRRLLNLLLNSAVLLISAALVERSYLLLGTERGFIFSDCGFDLGLPGWLALDQWLPWLYRVETSCGYTPELLFGITMAEALIVLSSLMFILSVILTSVGLYTRFVSK